ncbi:hypothetical protein VKT23_020136 [Stygiomarasmius scandens]|uniref:Uncharacterized protein n=1 Tax=Marasmiellus scandens TaxID=2682957 RepID=A0ABR1IMC8_9AGAR
MRAFNTCLVLVVGLVFSASARSVGQAYSVLGSNILMPRQDAEHSPGKGPRPSTTSLPDLALPDNCDGQDCMMFVNTVNDCRHQGQQNDTCGCTQDIVDALASCESCVASSEISSGAINGSDAASTSQQQLNLFIGLCNEAISRNSSVGISPLTSLNISFSQSIQTATLSITTTPLHPETAAPGATTSLDPGSGGGPGTTSAAPPNSAHTILSKRESWYTFFVIQILIFGSTLFH